jgi:hypothetical protein
MIGYEDIKTVFFIAVCVFFALYYLTKWLAK